METIASPEWKDYLAQTLNVWKGGGWTMIPLFIVAMAIYVSANIAASPSRNGSRG